MTLKILYYCFPLVIIYPITFTILDNLQENSQLKKKLDFPKSGRKRPVQIVHLSDCTFKVSTCFIMNRMRHFSKWLHNRCNVLHL